MKKEQEQTNEEFLADLRAASNVEALIAAYAPVNWTVGQDGQVVSSWIAEQV